MKRLSSATGSSIPARPGSDACETTTCTPRAGRTAGGADSSNWRTSSLHTPAAFTTERVLTWNVRPSSSSVHTTVSTLPRAFSIPAAAQ